MNILLKVKKLNNSAILPTKAYNTDAGYDFYSLQEDIIYPFHVKQVKTGIAMEIPTGYYMQLESRSSIVINYDVHVGAGIIDSAYRGEIIICMYNPSDHIFHFQIGTKIAQGILHKVEDTELVEVDNLGISERNTNGFGSSGITLQV